MKIWKNQRPLILSFIIMMASDIFAQNLGEPISTGDSSTTTGPTSPLESSAQLPNLLILPWQTPGIDADLLRQTNSSRNDALSILRQTLAPNAVTLDTIAPKKPAMESARYLLKSILAEPNSSAQPRPIAVLPLWAKIHNFDLFAVIVIDTARNTLLAINHRIFPSSIWQETLRSKDFKNYFDSGIQEITKTLNLASLATPNDDIALAIRDHSANPRANEIERSVLALLLGSAFVPEFTVQNPLASELLTTVHRFYSDPLKVRKANRELFTTFTYDKVPNKLSLPVKLTLKISAADGVFGRTLPWTWSEPFEINVKPDNTLDLKFSDRLRKELNNEKSALRRDELPKVTKIKGAWAYVDKGRAWGLQMNDRLVCAESPNDIKGHIVAYFGPELNLKSARGWSINEGAIIFIRKGQKKVKLGQTFTYDTKKVPTPWPP